MIPTIEEVVEMLATGRCTMAQALGWLNTHMELAASSDDGLRDHFAGQTLAGIYANMALIASAHQQHPGAVASALARMAYEQADAMVAARAAP